MEKLNLKPNLSAPDDFYADLIAAHEGLSDDDIASVNARLILLLANHIGDCSVLRQALSIAQNPSGEKAAG